MIVESFNSPFENIYNHCTTSDTQEILKVTQNNEKGLIFCIDTEYETQTNRKSMFGNSDLVLISFYGTWIDIEQNISNGQQYSNQFIELKDFLAKPIVFDLKNYESSDESYCLNYEMLEAIYPILNNPFIPKIYHNYAADYAVVMTALETLRHKKNKAQKLSVRGFSGDTMHMARMLNAGTFCW